MRVPIGYNSRCLKFLEVSYDDVFTLVEEREIDEEIINWCFANGRQPNEEEKEVWNQFMEKKGWRDEESAQLETYKAQSGLSNRDDIVTFFDYYEVDEMRKP